MPGLGGRGNACIPLPLLIQSAFIPVKKIQHALQKFYLNILLLPEICIGSGVSVLPHSKYLRTEEPVQTAH
jgi:hypothetical protein